MLTLAAMIDIDSIPIESFLCQNGNVVNRKKGLFDPKESKVKRDGGIWLSQAKTFPQNASKF